MSRSTAPLAPGRVKYQAPGSTTDRALLISRLQEWTRRFGHPPQLQDWASVEAHRDGISEGVRTWRSEHPHWPHSRAVVRMFGSWNEALEAAGIELPRASYPKGPLLQRYEAAIGLRSKGMSQSAIARELGISARTVFNYINADRFCPCGTPIIFGKADLCRDCSARQKLRRYTATELVEAALRWRSEYGSLPGCNEWRESDPRWIAAFPAWPSYGSAIGVFGRWSSLLSAARAGEDLFPLPSGLAEEEREGRLLAFACSTDLWPRHRIVEALQALSRRTGRAPEPEEWPEPTDAHPSSIQAARAFGTWPRALEAAGLGVSAPAAPPAVPQNPRLSLPPRRGASSR